MSTVARLRNGTRRQAASNLGTAPAPTVTDNTSKTKFKAASTPTNATANSQPRRSKRNAGASSTTEAEAAAAAHVTPPDSIKHKTASASDTSASNGDSVVSPIKSKPTAKHSSAKSNTAALTSAIKRKAERQVPARRIAKANGIAKRPMEDSKPAPSLPRRRNATQTALQSNSDALKAPATETANFIMSSPKRKPRDALARIASPRNRLVAAGDFGSKRRGDETDDSLSQAATLRPPVNKRIRTSANPGVQQLAKKTTNNGNIPNTPSSDDSEHGSSRGSSKLGRANGDISEDSRRGAGSPPSPLKSILSPMLDLLRRVSGIAQDPLGLQKQDSISSADSETSASDRAIDDDDGLRTIKKGSSENIHPMPSSSESQDENCPVDSAGAPVGSPEANSLTAPPMNPTTLGTATSSITSYVGGGFHANGMQLYLPESNEFVGADSCSASPITAGYPETPCKENIPVYTEHDVIVGLDTQESGVAMLSAATALSNTEALNQQQQPQPGQDQSNLLLAVNELRAADSDLDLSQISSLADSEIDAQYEQYLQYEDEEDEFNPYLFMADLPPIPKEHTLRPYALPRKTRSSPPITLVLDLDETLVHCALTKVENPDLEFAVEYNGVDYKVYCRLRPGYREFLEKASELFEVVVFTASQQVYADKLLNLIDPDRRFIRHRLFRDSCVYVNTNYVKDLGILGRDETKMVLVDNCPQAFAYQQSNGIPIESWYEDKNDRELMRLMDFLETLVGEEDVRPKVDAHFKTREKVIEAKKRYQLKISSITYGSSLYSSVRNTNN